MRAQDDRSVVLRWSQGSGLGLDAGRTPGIKLGATLKNVIWNNLLKACNRGEDGQGLGECERGSERLSEKQNLSLELKDKRMFSSQSPGRRGSWRRHQQEQRSGIAIVPQTSLALAVDTLCQSLPGMLGQ